MRSTSERMELLKKRTDFIKEKHCEKKRKAAIVLSYSLGIFFVAAISVFIGKMKFDRFEQLQMSSTASLFTENHCLGYIVVGIFAFILGVSVTLLCNMLHKKKEQGNG